VRSKRLVFGWCLGTIGWGVDLCLRTHDWFDVLAGLLSAFVLGLLYGTANARNGAEPGSPEANTK
jgi:hypothetical protein